MLSTLLIVIAVLIVAVLLFAATRPDAFRVQRSTRIQTQPERISPLIDDFHAWSGWSPWEKLDPSMTRTFSGPASGKGAGYAWTGNGKAGQGRMEITEASASKIVIDLEFIKPFAARNVAEFTLDVQGDGTTVIWAMSGKRPFIVKLMNLLLPMDKMVGKDFAAGLANLKALAEK